MSEEAGRILITGVSGFVGQSLSRFLATARFEVVAARRWPGAGLDGISSLRVDEYEDLARDPNGLAGVATIIHLADRADRRRYSAATVTEAESLVKALADASARAGVRRFILASSIYAENPGSTFYGSSKRKAEDALMAAPVAIPLCVALRLPPVLGLGGSGVMGTIVRRAALGKWLPLGCATAPRRFIGLKNLCDLVAAICRSDAHARTILTPSERITPSLKQLAQEIGAVKNRGANLLPVPFIDRLSPISYADPKTHADALAKLSHEFGWFPKYTLRDQLGQSG